MKLHFNIAVMGMLIPLGTSAQSNLQNQTSQVWNHKTCAVALTYDDGLNIHLDKVIPALDAHGFNGTFYIPGNAESLAKRMDEWKKAASHGHELGNHTLFHPCAGKSKKRDWVKPEYDLDNYTVGRMVDEIKLANTLLFSIDQKLSRTFAYTCGDKFAGDSSFVSHIKNEFAGARGTRQHAEQADKADLYDLGAFIADGQSGEELIAWVKQAQEEHALVVLLFHGVGGEHHMNISVEAHEKLLDYLKENEKGIWVAPLVEISTRIREIQAKQ